MQEQFNTALGNLMDKLIGWFNAIIQSIPNLILAILVMIAAYFTAKYVSRLVTKLVDKRVEQNSIKSAIARVSSVIVVALGLFIALGVLNLGKALTNAEQKTINGGYPARPLCRAKEVCHHFLTYSYYFFGVCLYIPHEFK